MPQKERQIHPPFWRDDNKMQKIQLWRFAYVDKRFSKGTQFQVLCIWEGHTLQWGTEEDTCEEWDNESCDQLMLS